MHRVNGYISDAGIVLFVDLFLMVLILFMATFVININGLKNHGKINGLPDF